jgi:hypothetical protein
MTSPLPTELTADGFRLEGDPGRGSARVFDLPSSDRED